MPSYSTIYYEQKQKAEMFKDLQRQKELGLLVEGAVTEIPHKYIYIRNNDIAYFEECFRAFNFTVSEVVSGVYVLARII